MSEQACICGADRPCAYKCPKHDRILHGYPCIECEREWRQAHPHTAEAISRFASGKGALDAIKRARKADEQEGP